MSRLKRAAHVLAWAVLLAAIAVAAGANWVSRFGYAEQQRDDIQLAPSAEHRLGTDELGRDRLARLAYGLRVSLALAPAAAALALLLASGIGLAAGWAQARGWHWLDGSLTLATDVMLGLPSLFALLAVRAALPLNLNAVASLVATGGLLAVLGWAASARLIRAATATAAQSNYVLQAEAMGLKPARIARRHIFPALAPIAAAQFLALVPAFLLAEANLSLLGLGVAEPLPSLGNLLNELTSLPPVASEPWIAAPAFVLVALVAALQLAVPKQRGIA